MPTEFTSDGVDFDDLFDPDIKGDGAQATWLENNGTPLRYAALSYGTKRADVGFEDGGVDVSNLWAAKGTAVYSITGLQGKSLSAGDAANTFQTTVSAAVWVSIKSDGTWSVAGSNSKGNVAQSAPTSGTWLPSGQAVSDYQVMFAAGQSGDGSITNGATAYSAATTNRTLTLSLPSISANNAIERFGSASVTIHLKRVSTGQVTTTTLSMNVSTVGYA